MKTTLRQLGIADEPEDELIWQFIGTRDLDVPLDVTPASMDDLADICVDGDTLLSMFKMATREQCQTVADYMARLKAESLSDAERTVVFNGDTLLNGYHRAVAAIKVGASLFAVDISKLPA